MTINRKLVDEIDDDISTYLTEEERKHLLSDLHRILVWVGVKLPETFHVDRTLLEKEMEEQGLTELDQPPELHMDKGSLDLHKLIWRLLNEEELSEKERSEIHELIPLLESVELKDEVRLKEAKLTHHEAKELYNEAAGVIRALLDLKDLLKKRERSDTTDKAIRKRVDDARRWQNYMKRLKEKGGFQ
jgi:hypothetical protein